MSDLNLLPLADSASQPPQGNAHVPQAHVSDLTAILFAVGGFTFWVLGDSCVKWIGQYGLPPGEIVAFMGFFMALTLSAQAMARRNLHSLRPHSYMRQSLRALLDTANNICVVVALRHLSLTMFYILVFTSPLVITVLSRIFLRERVAVKKAFALIVGFCGVVIAVAPWNSSQRIDLIGLISCLVCVACFSVNMVWSRVLTRTESPESLAFCSGLVTTIGGLAISSTQMQMPALALTPALALMGICCAAGTLCFYVAVKHTSASNVSQYHYTQLPTGALIAYLVWRDKPSLAMLIGGSMILGSGVLIALGARKAQPVVGVEAESA